jgi:hypothetical protein
MTPSIAIVFLRGGGPVTGFEVILFLQVAGAVMLAAVCWGIFGKWIERTRGPQMADSPRRH